ncbi:MAG: tyrosine-type recombinase/integrase, partial [Clostridia bacterium]|nr:tyrosine-type recombinase/integrase [Clostridia bacterium]
NNLINNYLEYLSMTGKSNSTCSRIIASLRCFFKYLISSNIIEKNPLEGIRPEKTKQKLPDVLEQKEILALLSQPKGTDYKSVRDKAMLELLYATGIKVSELIELKITDFNSQIGIIHLHSGKNERIIPIYMGAVKTLNEYLLNVRPVIVTDETVDNLFTNMNGQAMTRQGLWKLIKQYAESANIKKDITPHTLRHSFATHLLENGAQLKDIKEMLGHSDISSTQIYAQLIKTKYTKNYIKFHPLAK